MTAHPQCRGGASRALALATPPTPLLGLLVLVLHLTAPAAATDGFLGCSVTQPANITVMYSKLGPLYSGDLPAANVSFSCPDQALQALHDKAVQAAAGSNRKAFGPLEVMVEGGGYDAVWLETQPMAGAMYAPRDVGIALHNQLVFMRTQRADGRLAGVVHPNRNNSGLEAVFCLPGDPATCRSNCAPCCGSLLQGMYLAASAVDVAFFMLQSRDRPAYLQELYGVLQRFDGWLWGTRSAGARPGLLWLPGSQDWGGDGANVYNNLSAPFTSMDMSGYGHDVLRSLARVAHELGDAAAAAHYTQRAAALQVAARAGLWDAARGAYFDRDAQGRLVDTLMHNNLRAMWMGLMAQDMADTFVARHLMNSSEFWSFVPLPTVAINSPQFENKPHNCWCGQPEGLTFQRTIRALESYGHHAELVLVGKRLTAVLLAAGVFVQQYDPFNGTASGGPDLYGPTLLSFLEYTALQRGIVPRAEPGVLLWSSAVAGGGEEAASEWTQTLGPDTFVLVANSSGGMAATRNGASLFVCSGGARVVTDMDGVVTGLVGIADRDVVVVLQWPDGGELRQAVRPNEEWGISSSRVATLARSVPFTAPF